MSEKINKIWNLFFPQNRKIRNKNNENWNQTSGQSTHWNTVWTWNDTRIFLRIKKKKYQKCRWMKSSIFVRRSRCSIRAKKKTTIRRSWTNSEKSLTRRSNTELKLFSQDRERRTFNMLNIERCCMWGERVNANQIVLSLSSILSQQRSNVYWMCYCRCINGRAKRKHFALDVWGCARAHASTVLAYTHSDGDRKMNNNRVEPHTIDKRIEDHISHVYARRYTKLVRRASTSATAITAVTTKQLQTKHLASFRFSFLSSHSFLFAKQLWCAHYTFEETCRIWTSGHLWSNLYYRRCVYHSSRDIFCCLPIQIRNPNKSCTHIHTLSMEMANEWGKNHDIFNEQKLKRKDAIQRLKRKKNTLTHTYIQYTYRQSVCRVRVRKWTMKDRKKRKEMRNKKKRKKIR